MWSFNIADTDLWYHRAATEQASVSGWPKLQYNVRTGSMPLQPSTKRSSLLFACHLLVGFIPNTAKPTKIFVQTSTNSSTTDKHSWFYLMLLINVRF